MRNDSNNDTMTSFKQENRTIPVTDISHKTIHDAIECRTHNNNNFWYHKQFANAWMIAKWIPVERFNNGSSLGNICTNNIEYAEFWAKLMKTMRVWILHTNKSRETETKVCLNIAYSDRISSTFCSIPRRTSCDEKWKSLSFICITLDLLLLKFRD